MSSWAMETNVTGFPSQDKVEHGAAALEAPSMLLTPEWTKLCG